jgi:hypothetical protein
MHAADVMHATSYLLHGAIADKIPPEELLVAPPPPSSPASSPAGASSRCARLAPAGPRREGSALGEGDAACGALARPRASWGKQRVPNSGQEPGACPPPPISFPTAIPRSAPTAAGRACRLARGRGAACGALRQQVGPRELPRRAGARAATGARTRRPRAAWSPRSLLCAPGERGCADCGGRSLSLCRRKRQMCCRSWRRRIKCGIGTCYSRRCCIRT